jgi:DegV family protein with EDD domain
MLDASAPRPRCGDVPCGPGSVAYSGAVAGVAVVTDSTSSLSRDTCARAEVRVIPLQVVVDDVSRPESPDESGPGSVTPSLVAAALRAGRRITTSRPTPEAFAAVYHQLAEKGYSEIVSVHLSRAMSGTVEAARLAGADAPIPVTVVDSRTIAMAAGFAVLAGASAARAGASAREVAALVRKRADTATTYFSVASLEYLRRGGRIGAASALLGSALAVKPLLTITDGKIQPFERVRTTSRALARLEELGLAALAMAAGRYAGVDIAVHHLDDASGAAEMVARLRGRVSTPVDIIVSEMSAVLGVHVGPGTLGIVVSPRV